MSEAAAKAFELFRADIGNDEGTGEWFQVTQDQIDQFADVTHDHQFIHVDPEACKTASPWGVPIAHGFLTLSMLTRLYGSVRANQDNPPALKGVLMGVNYGFEKVRFINPVKVGSKIRATSVLKAVELKDPNTVHTTASVTVEIDGETKPALVADWITRLAFS
jgi:acyl dehydratase